MTSGLQFTRGGPTGPQPWSCSLPAVGLSPRLCSQVPAHRVYQTKHFSRVWLPSPDPRTCSAGPLCRELPCLHVSPLRPDRGFPLCMAMGHTFEKKKLIDRKNYTLLDFQAKNTFSALWRNLEAKKVQDKNINALSSSSNTWNCCLMISGAMAHPLEVPGAT